MKTAYIIVDLGFGDAGKGSMVDYLAQTRNASAIVRYTGGPHAAHHVVRADGVSHAFCQFGATFKEGTRTHLGRGVVVKPENIIYEGRALESKGVSDPFARLSIHPGCRLVTSYHAMLCQMKEVARGAGRFGTVGIGVGEAVRESEEYPDLALRIADLYDPETLHVKLCLHYERTQRQVQAILRDHQHSPVYAELNALHDRFLNQVRLKNVLANYQVFAEQFAGSLCPDRDFIEQYAEPGGDIIFEGAHAVLLDREHGYYPYVAKTDTTTNEALRILQESHFSGSIYTIGVVRALGYRHGPGPFVTEDPRLSNLFEENHNRANEWQGKIRYGWFDLLAIRHSIQLNQQVDAIALTMVDHFSRLDQFKVCLSYEYLGNDRSNLEKYFHFSTQPSGRIKITGIKPTPTHRSDALSRLLFDCVPWDWEYFNVTDRTLDEWIHFLESADGLGLPVQFVSSGPTLADKTELRK